MGRSWTKEEDNILRAHYSQEGGQIAARLPGRTASACKQRAEKLHIAYDKSNLNAKRTDLWSSKEDEILRDYYPEEGKACFARLPNRTKDACYKRAENLGLVSETGRAVVHGVWTPEEDEILRKYYPIHGMDCFVLLPNRTQYACRHRTVQLGLLSHREYEGAWDEEEDKILKMYYGDEGSDCFQRIPYRSIEACRMRVKKLGLYYFGNHKKYDNWPDIYCSTCNNLMIQRHGRGGDFYECKSCLQLIPAYHLIEAYVGQKRK